MRRPRLLRPSYFLWIPALAVFLIFGGALGRAHVIWSYDWRDNGTYDPAAHRHYTRCTYVGWHGAITEYPTDGRCGWLRFAHNAETRR